MLWSLALGLCILALIVPQLACAADAPPAYSDRDLDKYRNPADGTSSTASVPVTRTAKHSSRADKNDREYWCKEGTKRSRAVEAARDRVQSAETAVAKHQDSVDRKPSDKAAAKRLSAARKKLAKEQKILIKEEAARSSFENRAHRQGIPPGWLNCNFNY